MKLRNYSALPLAALVGLALTATSAHATVININNAGFETSSTGIGNGNNTDIDDWTEDVGDAYVDMNGTLWVPEASDTLYIGSASVNQDLSHNWSATDSFTVGLIAMNPRWFGGTAELRVQLRQASDDAVLWDSGLVDVTGTVTTTAPATYTGTGHDLSWNIDASTFVTGSAGEQINIRIENVTGTVYADNVSLSVDTIPEPSSAALLGLAGLALLRRRR